MESVYLVSAEGTQTIAGMPPGGGAAATIPHALTFMGMTTGAGRVYSPSDEALRQSRENARYMRADAAVMECVELRQRAAALCDWRIECEEDDARARQISGALRTILRRIPRFTQYREALLSAVWFGRAAVENVFQWDWIDGARTVAVAGWSPIHGDKLVWRLDQQSGRYCDDEVGVRIAAGAASGERGRRWYDAHRGHIHPTDFGLAYFPPPHLRELIVVHRHMIEDGEYEEPRNAGRVFGVGIRSRVYWVWYQKQQALRWLMEFLERSAFGIELWYYPAGNAEARQEMLEAAQNRVGTGKSILLVPRPPGGEGMIYGVERVEPSMAGAEVLQRILSDYFGHQIKRYVLGQTLTTEAASTGLGSNLASIHLDTFLQIVRYDCGNLEETISEQLVQRLVRWNWPGVDPRLFRFRIEVDRPDVESRLASLRQAWEMGLALRTADVRDLLGVAAPSRDEECLRNPAFAAATPLAAPSPGGARAAEKDEEDDVLPFFP